MDRIRIYSGFRLEPWAPKEKLGELHILSGSFNPAHDAHLWIYNAIDEVAENNIPRLSYGRGSSVFAATAITKFFEISTKRLDKEDLDSAELQRRLQQFRDIGEVLVLEDPLFVDKALSLQPYAQSVVFHIGYDNYVRLLRVNGRDGVQSIPARFCVWSRWGEEFTTGPRNCFSAGIDLPEEIAELSSTQLRRKSQSR